MKATEKDAKAIAKWMSEKLKEERRKALDIAREEYAKKISSLRTQLYTAKKKLKDANIPNHVVIVPKAADMALKRKLDLLRKNAVRDGDWWRIRAQYWREAMQ